MNIKQLKQRVVENFDNYRLSTLVSLPLALIFLIVALGVSLDFVNAAVIVVDLVVIPAFVARLISASSYLGRLVDAWGRNMRLQNQGYESLNAPQAKPIVNTLFNSPGVVADRVIFRWERWLTTIGVLLGLGIGIGAAIVLGGAIPLVPSLSVLAYPIYVAGFIGIIGGLFNRLGLIADNRVGLKASKNTRDKTELRLMLVGSMLGLALGVALLATSSASLAVVAGVTPFLALGVFPFWLSGLVFVLISMSVFISAADYIAKSFSYLRTYFDASFNAQLKAKQIMHEHRGSLVGVLLGASIGIAVTIALVLTLSLTGLAGAAIGTLIILTAVGVVGGLSARVARMVDRLAPVEQLSPSDAQERMKVVTESSRVSPPASPPASPEFFQSVSPQSAAARARKNTPEAGAMAQFAFNG